MEPDPTELVSCGKCSSVNSVPFGLDKFRCYKCGVSVAISRASSAACAAASPTALYYEGLQSSQGTASVQTPAVGSEAKRTEGAGTSGFFGKLQRQLDKTFFVKEGPALLAGNSSSSSSSAAAPVLPTGKPGTEEEQLQWALNASQDKSGQKATIPAAKAKSLASPKNGEVSKFEPPPRLGDKATDAQIARLKEVEGRAARADQLLQSAIDREAVSATERMSLREQLDENEGLIQGLAQQLDMVQAELQERLRQCEALERTLASALVEAAAAVAAGAAKSCKVDVVQEAGEGKACSTSAGIVPELLARIAELEATLEGVTCGAKDQSQAKTFASQKNGEVSTFEPPPRLGDKAASLIAASS